MASKGSRKKVLFFGPATKKGGGWAFKGLSTKKKDLFLKLEKKKSKKNVVATKLEGGGVCKAGPLKKYIFFGFPKKMYYEDVCSH